MNKCEKCGFLHYRTDPCRVKKESLASPREAGKPKTARPDTSDRMITTDASGRMASVTGGESAASSEGSRQSALASELAGRGNASLKESETAGETATIPKPNLGRPRIHPDRKAYRAAWMRQYRARKKASAEGRG